MEKQNNNPEENKPLSPDPDQSPESPKMHSNDPQKNMRGPVSSFMHNLGKNVRDHGGEHTNDKGSGGQKMDGYEDA
ncbi:hypothetical protein [Flaviaesturariibacter aridisoli]|uniref:Uncharacterized protein n=1 Tax=Flaviaesturariibacter aridisoli TaxID=2545761 RepID=A0A4R4DUI9_9BACT|nr:hypothetical protein [Flaviaesturariibacter aridisoli]RYY63395.1 MAG: hypothetical protein EOO12_12395 [Chitinophagaceae bacterium]RYZ16385.1 MAG: hypothetical protein EOO16_25905 [Chitinophagaceae bacterium]TCZ64774.1 hypothetical protein E0486_17890 [Flaviaesturariibacter aridisoli]